ncbi:hypothetical protein AGDE_12722 [Angomonas deanei]|nr:hypothetical protein AGDE_12722 [Angomonas deanei]|eukprot:EPY23802.1 hypothetical protein AGDE_12722 [Angomonas deanei]
MPSPNLGYVDSVHVAEVQDLLCSSNGILLQYPNVKQTSITVAKRLLFTDVFCRVVALQSAEKLLRLVAQEEGKGLMDDVLSCLQAQLSVSGKAQFVFPFVVEQTCIFLSRALAKYSDENVTAKCIELLWSTLLSDPKQRTLSVLHFSHLLLDCVVSVTDPETPRFELLGKLLDPVKGENYTDASMRDDITKLATHRGVAGGLSNAYTPLSFRMEISESSNFVMNLLTDSRNILLLSPTAFYLSKLSEMEEKNGVDRAATSLVCVHDSMATFRESDPYTPVVARQEQRILETLLEYMEKWELLFFGVLNHFDFSYHDKMSFLRLLRAKASSNKEEYFQWVTMGGKCLISLCRAEEDVWWILSALVVLHSGASEENIILTCLHKSVEKQKIVFKRLLESNCADRDALILFLEDIMRDDNPSEVITSVWKEAQLLLPGQ